MKWLALISIGGTTGLLCAAFAGQQRWLLALAAGLLGAIWLAGSWKLWVVSNDAGLLVAVGLAGAAVILDDATILPLLAIVFALAGWDLTRFAQREAAIDVIQNAGLRRRVHLQWLGVVCAGGLAVGILAENWRLSLGLGWIVLLGLLAAFSLSWLVSLVKSRGL